MILGRPPQAVHSLMSEENTRASRVAHSWRWPQAAALDSRSAACSERPREAKHKGAVRTPVAGSFRIRRRR